jgi:hypothetical protein
MMTTLLVVGAYLALPALLLMLLIPQDHNTIGETKMSKNTVGAHPIPPDLVGQQLCVLDICLETATQTICATPETCYRNSGDNESCRQYVACDQHAALLGHLVWGMLTRPPIVEVVPPRGQYGGHD